MRLGCDKKKKYQHACLPSEQPVRHNEQFMCLRTKQLNERVTVQLLKLTHWKRCSATDRSSEASHSYSCQLRSSVTDWQILALTHSHYRDQFDYSTVCPSLRRLVSAPSLTSSPAELPPAATHDGLRLVMLRLHIELSN